MEKTYLFEELRNLESKEKMLLKMISTLQETCNGLQIEKLHLQSLKDELKLNKSKEKDVKEQQVKIKQERIVSETMIVEPKQPEKCQVEILTDDVNLRKIDLSITNQLNTILEAEVIDTESDEEDSQEEKRT